MNKLLIGDWHLKASTNMPKPYQQWEQKMMMESVNKMLEIASSVDEVYLMGDIFDTINIDRELYYLGTFLGWCQDNEKKVLIFDGNHERIGGNQDKDYLLNDRMKEYLELYGCEVVDWKEDKDAIFASHKVISKLETCRKKKKYLFSHIRTAESKDKWTNEIDIENMLERFETIFLGDLHGEYEKFDGKVIYTNSPIDTKFDEVNSNTKRGVIILNDDGSWKRVYTLTDKYRKCVKKYNTVADFIADVENLEKDTQNFYKAKVYDIAPKLASIKKRQYNNIIIEPYKIEISADETIKQMKSEAVAMLKSSTIQEDFWEFVGSTNDRAELEPYIDNIRGQLEK